MKGFGVRPLLATAPPSELKARAAPARETSLILSDSARPLFISSALIRFGVTVGSSWKPIAAAPAARGADIEVPPARMYWPSTTHSGHIAVNALPGARFETMWAPGA